MCHDDDNASRSLGRRIINDLPSPQPNGQARQRRDRPRPLGWGAEKKDRGRALAWGEPATIPCGTRTVIPFIEISYGGQPKSVARRGPSLTPARNPWTGSAPAPCSGRFLILAMRNCGVCVAHWERCHAAVPQLTDISVSVRNCYAAQAHLDGISKAVKCRGPPRGAQRLIKARIGSCLDRRKITARQPAIMITVNPSQQGPCWFSLTCSHSRWRLPLVIDERRMSRRALVTLIRKRLGLEPSDGSAIG